MSAVNKKRPVMTRAVKECSSTSHSLFHLVFFSLMQPLAHTGHTHMSSTLNNTLLLIFITAVEP